MAKSLQNLQTKFKKKAKLSSSRKNVSGAKQSTSDPNVEEDCLFHCLMMVRESFEIGKIVAREFS